MRRLIRATYAEFENGFQKTGEIKGSSFDCHLVMFCGYSIKSRV